MRAPLVAFLLLANARNFEGQGSGLTRESDTLARNSFNYYLMEKSGLSKEYMDPAMTGFLIRCYLPRHRHSLPARVCNSVSLLC